MLYIMRHGRTVWNMEHKLQGKTDVPLSEAGRPWWSRPQLPAGIRTLMFVTARR